MIHLSLSKKFKSTLKATFTIQTGFIRTPKKEQQLGGELQSLDQSSFNCCINPTFSEGHARTIRNELGTDCSHFELCSPAAKTKCTARMILANEHLDDFTAASKKETFKRVWDTMASSQHLLTYWQFPQKLIHSVCSVSIIMFINVTVVRFALLFLVGVCMFSKVLWFPPTVQKQAFEANFWL